MKKRHLIEAILFLSYLLFSTAWMAGTLSMHHIMAQVGLHSLAQASTLTTALTVAKIAGSALAAYVMSRLGLRHAITLSAILIGLGIVTPFATTFPLLLLSRFLLGLGGAFMLVYLNPAVVGWFAERELTFVNGLNNMAFNLGIVLAMSIMPWATSVTGDWRAGLVMISTASIVLAVLWLMFGQPAPRVAHASRAPENTYRFRDGLRDRFTWTYTLTFSGLLSFYVVLFTFYPNAGIGQAHTVLVAGIAGGLCGTLLSGRIRRRMLMLRVSGALQLASAIVLSFASSPAVVFCSAIVLGFALFFPIATLFTVGQKQPGMTSARVSVRYSIFWAVAYLAATVATTVFAKIVDAHHGDYHVAFMFICVVESSFLIGALLLKDRQHPEYGYDTPEEGRRAVS